MRVNSYFYTGDHLCSTSVVLDIDGNISQSVTCVPYGEISLQISINFPTFAERKTKGITKAPINTCQKDYSIPSYSSLGF